MECVDGGKGDIASAEIKNRGGGFYCASGKGGPRAEKIVLPDPENLTR